MSLFPDQVLAAVSNAPATVPRRPAAAETTGVVPCGCGDAAIYLLGGGVFCETCLFKTLRGRKLLNKRAVVPVILRCASGFRRVRCGDALDFQPLGDFERVQPCAEAECRRLFPVHQFWTGEPAVCPACSAAAFREIYPA
jgi:hypothetical protein